MSGQRLRKDMHILFRGREYLIDRRLRNGNLCIKDVATSEFKTLPEIQLVEALFDGELEFIGYEGSYSYMRAKADRSYIEDLSLLNETDPKQKKRKEEARRRYRYVNEVLTKRVSTLTKETLDTIIERAAKSINDPKRPSWSTLYNWVRAFIESGEDLRALVPAWDKRGNTTPRYTGVRVSEYSEADLKKAREVAAIIEEVVEEKYLSPQRRSVRATYKLLEGYILDINRKRSEQNKLPTPHIDSLYRYISKLDVHKVDTARYGKKYADRKHTQIGKTPRPTHPLERVQIDHTKTDLMCVDMERRLPVGRATLTDAIDVRTAMILGSYLGFEPASYLTVMQCLLNAIKPKTYIKTLYPEVENEWECYGLPEVLIVDNGKEFYSMDLEDACLQLGMSLEYSPPGCPEYKASKERYYASLNTQLLHNIPGTTFSNMVDRGDYDPRKNAFIDIRDMNVIHHLFNVDIYPRQYHKGIRDVPARLWSEEIEKFPPALPPKGADLRVLLGHVAWRQVRREGIELFGLFYNNDELAPLRRRTKDGKVKVKYDPTDIGEIHVADSENGNYILVCAVDYEYAEGLSLYQHDVIRRQAREIADDYVNPDALWRARKKVEDIVEQSWEKSRKNTTRTALARFKKYGGQTNYGILDEEVEHTYPRGDSEHQGKVLRMNPEAAGEIAGISDFQNELPDSHLIRPELSASIDTTALASSSPSLVISQPQSRASNNGRHKKKENPAPASPIENEVDDDVDDSEYEWSADYGVEDS